MIASPTTAARSYHRFIDAIGARIERIPAYLALQDPHYDTERDVIRMHGPKWFNSSTEFYSVFAHEHGHWTGHKNRVDRVSLFQGGPLGHACEEMTAEICAASVLAMFKLTPQPRVENLNYVLSHAYGVHSDERLAAIKLSAKLGKEAVDYLVEAARKNGWEYDLS